jgi:hypothetical protein
VSRIDDASVYQSVELVNTTVRGQRADRFDERAWTSTNITETSDELVRRREHDVNDSVSNSRARRHEHRVAPRPQTSRRQRVARQGHVNVYLVPMRDEPTRPTRARRDLDEQTRPAARRKRKRMPICFFGCARGG